MNVKLFVTLVTLSSALSSPIGEGLSKLAEKASHDFLAVVNGTNVQLADVLERKANIIKMVGSTSANAVLEAGKVLSNQVNAIEVEKILNDTEARVLETKTNLIKSAFETKRQIAKYISDSKETHQGIVLGLLNSTANGVDAVLNSTANGIIFTKEGVAQVTGHINTDNAQWALNQANNALVAAVNSTITALQQTGNALVQALVNAKMSLQNVALSITSITTGSGTNQNANGTSADPQGSGTGHTGSPSTPAGPSNPNPTTGYGPTTSGPVSGTGPTTSAPVSGTGPTSTGPTTSISGTATTSTTRPNLPSEENGITFGGNANINASVSLGPANNWGISQTLNGLVQSLISIKSKTLPTVAPKLAENKPVATTGVASSNPLVQ